MIIARIARNAGLDAEFLERVISTASFRYKTYVIPKKTGGVREIAHPSKELKFLQRWLVDNVFVGLPVHESVYSYRIGIGIRAHALAHVHHNYLLRIDFSHFFPSIKAPDVARLITRNREQLPLRLSRRDIQVICQIVCRKHELTIGAPSSPSLSNAILFQLDSFWTTRCNQSAVTYSRYADDLYFSTNEPNVLAGILAEFETYVHAMKSPRLQINRQKTVFTSRKRRRHVTGLVLSSENKISIGRTKKRWTRSLVNSFKNGQLSDEQTSQLRGYLAFAMEVEPSFYQSLEIKYGKDLIQRLMQWKSSDQLQEVLT
jgi:RNA-directed DNA polymerase